jgi:hypothetical protein
MFSISGYVMRLFRYHKYTIGTPYYVTSCIQRGCHRINNIETDMIVSINEKHGINYEFPANLSLICGILSLLIKSFPCTFLWGDSVFCGLIFIIILGSKSSLGHRFVSVGKSPLFLTLVTTKQQISQQISHSMHPVMLTKILGEKSTK